VHVVAAAHQMLLLSLLSLYNKPLAKAFKHPSAEVLV
jgi:hypothetical protein